MIHHDLFIVHLSIDQKSIFILDYGYNIFGSIEIY